MALTAIEPTSWDALRQLRLGGRKPTLPVIVTSKEKLPRRLEGVGCMTILHKAGEVMPIKLLEDLDVIFFFDRCELASHVRRLAKEKGVKFGWTQTWCTCGSMLTVLPMACDSMAEMVKWAEGPHAAA
jgi:hypothetical protein